MDILIKGFLNERIHCGRCMTRPDGGSYHAGFSDPVYAEAYVTVHQYDIVLDCTIINKTTETLQNVCLELATMGDLKLVERPHNYTLAPGATNTIRCTPKTSMSYLTTLVRLA